ncbi:hypothetical protein AArcCO_1203 [Halalkaliarchaeum sp. AArc-CO]|nr:hypothetical protein AArcCO_1203 [Halalkaliarchaeum sp. AArc-CO]
MFISKFERLIIQLFIHRPGTLNSLYNGCQCELRGQIVGNNHVNNLGRGGPRLL